MIMLAITETISRMMTQLEILVLLSASEPWTIAPHLPNELRRPMLAMLSWTHQYLINSGYVVHQHGKSVQKENFDMTANFMEFCVIQAIVIPICFMLNRSSGEELELEF